MTMIRTVELALFWRKIWNARRFIVIFTLTASVLVAGISLLLPKMYEARCSLLPPSEEESGLGIVSLLKGIGVPGVKVPTQAAPADVFVAILSSRHIAEEIVRKFDLMKRYKQKMMVDAIKELRSHTHFNLTEAGLVEVVVEDSDPKMAADMANAFVELLDRFNRDSRMTRGRRTRIFVERRLQDTRDSLAKAEERLAKYQAANKAVALSPEASSAIETAARLYAERAALNVRLGVIRGYTTEGSDEEIQTMQRLKQIDRQLQALPETGLELARLFRDVKTQEQLWILLTGQYEEARITEARDIPTVEVLDEAVPPQRRSSPKRGLMVIVTFILALAVSVAYALMRDGGDARPAS